ncbi:MAG: cell envelope integrity protein TolA [Candidatus Symbiodolus clandestinus]
MRRYLFWFLGSRWMLASLAVHSAIILAMVCNKRLRNLPSSSGIPGVMHAVLIHNSEWGNRNSKAGLDQNVKVNKTQNTQAVAVQNSQINPKTSKDSIKKTETSTPKTVSQPAVVEKQPLTSATQGVAIKSTADAQTELLTKKKRLTSTKSEVKSQKSEIMTQKGVNQPQAGAKLTAGKAVEATQKENINLDQFFNQLAAGGTANASPAQTAVNAQASSHYGAQIQQVIQANLIRHPSFQGKRCEITLQLAPDGMITRAQVRQGDGRLCEAALRAIGITGRVPAPTDPALYELFKQFTISFEL